MKVIASLAMIGMLMSGCAAIDSPEKARARTVLACDGYARTLSTLSVYRQKDRLTPAQIRSVDQARPFFNEACDRDAEPVGPATLDKMEAMLLDMAMIQTEVAK
jgi:hypothetical protein